jgi:PKD repeat protein
MKTTINKLSVLFAAVLMAVFMISCGEDEVKVDAPSASFTFVVSAENTLSVTFTNASKDGETYAWDFGDGTGTSTDENPTYTYAAGGKYSVVLTATNAGGSDESTKVVTVVEAVAQNLITNGDFVDETGWTLQQFNTYANATVAIGSGVLTIGEVNPDAAWGAEAHGGAWQAVTVSGGKYVFDLNISVAAADEMWAEVWVGSIMPVENDDYNGDDDATAVLKLNTWDCGDAQKTYSGSLLDNNCVKQSDNSFGGDGILELAAGTYYVTIRCGGIVFPTSGVIIDNVSMKEVK